MERGLRMGQPILWHFYQENKTFSEATMISPLFLSHWLEEWYCSDLLRPVTICPSWHRKDLFSLQTPFFFFLNSCRTGFTVRWWMKHSHLKWNLWGFKKTSGIKINDILRQQLKWWKKFMINKMSKF